MASEDALERFVEELHAALDVVQLVEPEQADPEGSEIGRFVALQRYPGGGLESGGETSCQTGSPGRRCSSPPPQEPGSLSLTRWESPSFEQRAHPLAELQLFGLDLVETVLLGFEHHIADPAEASVGMVAW